MASALMTAPNAEVARRVRAARTYAGLTVPELAEKVGLGVQTIKRIESGRRSARSFEAWAIAEACGLPREFFELDFREFEARPEATACELHAISERLARIETRLGITENRGQVGLNGRDNGTERASN